mgnify:CR=1 FL=1
MREYNPIFKLSDKMINLLTQISEEVGRVGVLFEGKINVRAKSLIIKKVHTLLLLEDCNLSPECIENIISPILPSSKITNSPPLPSTANAFADIEYTSPFSDIAIS